MSLAPVHCQTKHHHHSHAHFNESLLLRTAELASAAALTLFSAMADLQLFTPFFLAGIAVGFYQNYGSSSCEETAETVGASCSQGFLEQITRTKLPPLLSLGANLAITWCHIDHHTTIFVPIVALSIGAWAGKLATKTIG